MARVLVVGGAGYVGSSVSAWLIEQGHDIWVLDDLSTGRRGMALGRGFTLARAGDHGEVLSLLEREKFDCVMHFAAKCIVSESVERPQEYFENNVEQTRILLDTMIEAGVKKFIFSSTCAIFGQPDKDKIDESCVKAPLNPYGETKLKVEEMLATYAKAKGMQAIALRYFNASGAEPKLRVGECHDPETHLIPKIISAALDSQPVEVYGTDYPTPDKTCIRDYIHVTDLASAHESALIRLLGLKNGQGCFEAYNIGSENGYSVREIIAATEKITGKRIGILEQDRRPGDPPRLVANSSLAREKLGFNPKFKLTDIIRSAWEWEKKRRSMLKKAIFLDRDGTINEDPGYLSDPSQLKLFPAVGDGLQLLKKAGFELIVVSNQSGVGRGFIKEEALEEIHKALDKFLSPYGVRIDGYKLCLHHPEDGCDCRKPKPKLILDAAKEMNIDLRASYMIGDKISDMLAGRQSGCKRVVLVRTGSGKDAEHQSVNLSVEQGCPDYIADSLLPAARWIASQENADS